MLQSVILSSALHKSLHHLSRALEKIRDSCPQRAMEQYTNYYHLYGNMPSLQKCVESVTAEVRGVSHCRSAWSQSLQEGVESVTAEGRGVSHCRRAWSQSLQKGVESVTAEGRGVSHCRRAWSRSPVGPKKPGSCNRIG